MVVMTEALQFAPLLVWAVWPRRTWTAETPWYVAPRGTGVEISRSLSKHGNVFPRVFSLLANLPADRLHHVAHGLRLPGAIYNLSISRVLRAFATVLDEVGALATTTKVVDGRPVFADERVLAAQSELLDAMLAHIDDGYQILKACHPYDACIREQFADRWLEKAGHPGVRHFKSGIKSYREGVGAIANRIKHQHGQLRFVAFYDVQATVAGYYLEGVGPDGVVQPDASVHPRMTGVSFNRDLRWHFVQLFAVSDALSGALQSSLRAQHIAVSGRPVQQDSSGLIGVAERVAGLGTMVFPDESTKAVPHVRVRRDGGDVEIALRYPSLAVLVPPRPHMVTLVTSRGDGFSRQFRFPYHPGNPASPVPPRVAPL